MIQSKWNLDRFEAIVSEIMKIREVVEWMKYGWLTGRLPDTDRTQQSGRDLNHKGAAEHPDALRKHIEKEAVATEWSWGHLKEVPFSR